MKPRLVLLLLLGAIALPTFAQFTSGVEGTVIDPAEAVVPGATITVTAVETGATRTVTTSAAGYYRITSLPAATFNISVTASGFKTVRQENTRLQTNETKTINFTLELGTTDTQITVTDTPPPVETSEGRITGVVEESKVRELPLVGRNFFTLVVLTPGVTGLPAGGGQSYSQATGDIFTVEYGVALNANGQRSAGNNFMVDSATTNNVAHGGLTNFSPNAESVQEIRVFTNNFSAEYGRNSSVLVNVVTKQGTNDLHGSLSWFHTNNVLTSRSIFQADVPVFRRNEGAWSIGGPIRKNQTFFFGSMDILRSGVATARPIRVETPEFVSFLKQVRPNNISTDVFARFPASVRPTSNFQNAGSFLGQDCGGSSSPIDSPIGPVPCNLPVTGEANYGATLPRDGFQWNARIDHYFNNQNDRLYGNIYRTTLNTVLFNDANPRPQFTEPWFQYTLYGHLNETHIFSPTVINEMGASVTRSSGDNVCDPCDIPGIGVNGIQGFGQGWGPGAFVQNIYEWRDVLTFNSGTHNIKIGGNIQHNQDYDDFGRIVLRPSYFFPSIFDFANDDVFSQDGMGIDPASGQKATSSLRYIASRDGNMGLFVHDDWKVRPNLTINAGLRWESYGNPLHRHDTTINMLFPSGNDFKSRIANGKVDYTANNRLLAGTDHNNFAPRLAFAWDPSGKGRTAVRGGVGTFYNRLATGAYNGVQSNPPRIALVSASKQIAGTRPIFALGTTPDEPFGFPLPEGITAGLDERNGLLSGKAGIAAVDPNLRTSYSFNWFFGAQQAFGSNWVFQANYIGSSSHKLYNFHDVNRYTGNLLETDGNLTRLNPSFGSITYVQNLYNSVYHGATFALKKRFGAGVNLDAAYTIGKVIDGGYVGGGGNETDTFVADVDNIRRERGLAVFDIPQRYTFSVYWEIPGPKAGPAFFRGLLSGWQLGNVSIFQSGSPFSVYCQLPFIPVRDDGGSIVGNSGCDYNADGVNYDYPNAPSFGGGGNFSRADYIRGVFAASDFPTPALGQQGNLGRSIYRNPGYANTDITMAKRMTIPMPGKPDGAMLQFRAEFFNAFNRVNLGSVVQDLGNPLFGRSSSAYPGRNIQFGLRLAF